METDPLPPERRDREDGSWWTWFSTLFASDTSARSINHPSGDSGVVPPTDAGQTSHHDSGHGSDGGGGDSGGGDGGGGGGD